MLGSVLALLLGTAALSLGTSLPDDQVVFAQSPRILSDEAVLAALKAHPDPVEALLSLQPDIAAELAQPRLLHLLGQQEPEWMTEGDKLRLRRRGKKFVDITDHQEFYAQQVGASAGKASEWACRILTGRLLVYLSYSSQICLNWLIRGLSSPFSGMSRRRECTGLSNT